MFDTSGNDYYSWLIEQISDYDYSPDVESYQLLLQKLYYTEFCSIINRDENRITDGLYLRNKYDEDCGVPFDMPYDRRYLNDGHDYCSILEMLIALSRRIEDDLMYDPSYGDRCPEWFWTMINNLGLLDYDDDHFNEPDVEHILYFFVYRKYEPDGTGNIFYTDNQTIDMRTLEIWYQVNRFIEEFVV